ncbi:IS66 family transposase zinc-finger binding domain-containing protein [Legionella londiniensis]|uniref:Putative Helix-turn-helix domain of transposase IS66 n=1 Tax=Legionella londiniensis TaxID=45068 RepID=A0A0W0VIB3_9GAMM|nr:IS66 family transposase zinc-finger binding domain-containing protein [Legionella londiniensis]KTD19847.1 putative Helix-turn-helix domain of transposase IS66 [Legionella londiniensis]STX93543.1 putative Helix-turn-helix domain of transposase IS66 [Legionella londiniensis]
MCRLPSRCECGGRIRLKEEHQRHQVYELPQPKLHVTEYHLEKGRCSCCNKNHVAELPEGVTGPNLTSFMSQMISKYKLSRRELQEFLNEQYNFKLSLGFVFNKQKLVNKALEKPVYVARTMSFIMTCKLQAKNSFEFLKETMQCFFANSDTPSLILS